VETQNQRLALESLYKEMSGSRDEWALAEVEQDLLIANQQLQLAGNVKAALIALETADMRLSRLDRPQLTQLRRVINRDIERLRTAPYVDVTGMAVRLDQIAGSVDALTLSMDARPSRTGPAPSAASAGFWSRLWAEAVQDFRDLVRVQHSMEPDVPLIAPGQAYFLRENLKIRLLGARLALLARDEAGFRADLKAASAWLDRYYDTQDKAVAAARTSIDQLARAEVGIDLPDISASLDAARGLRLVRERTLR
jgi:uroporphyrin-III C-methyltransferase